MALAILFAAPLRAQSSRIQTYNVPLYQIASVELPDAPLPQQSTSSSSNRQTTQDGQPQDSQAVDDQKKKREQHDEAERVLKQEEHQRIAGVLPNFNTVIGGSAPPLSAGQKMRASFRSAVDPAQFVIAGISAAYGQATDSHSSIDSTGFRHGYDQGWTAYVKRYGAAYADQFDGTILGNGVFPALLHQDARYFRLGTGTVRHRIVYAAATTIRCKGDNGRWQPSFSNLLGNLAAGGISNLYYPAAERGFGLTIQQGLIVTAEGTLGSFLLEFYPDVSKRMHKKRKDPVSASVKPQGDSE